MESYNFFTYSWHIDDEEDNVTSIRVYGLDKQNKTVCVKINDFTPYCYIELPNNINWTPEKAQLLGNKIDQIVPSKKPLKKSLLYKKRLYYAHVDKNKKIKNFPYLFLSFATRGDIKNLSYKLRNPLSVIGVGKVKLKMHEHNASEILQLTSLGKIPTAGWVSFAGKRVEKEDERRITTCDHEFTVKWKNMKQDNSCDNMASPLIMSFDIEVNSTDPTTMPNAGRSGDKVFQISCVLGRHGTDMRDKYLLTLSKEGGRPTRKKTGKDVTILNFDTEADLLEGYTNFVQEKNPNLILGYNILGFDIPYMIERAKNTMCIFNFDQQGFNKYAHAKEREISWSSSAYKNQTFKFLDAEGRLYVDLLPLVRRDYKMDNYKLKTISDYFLGETKDPLDAMGIFKCYEIGMKGGKKGSDALSVVGKYCFVEGTNVSTVHGDIPIETMTSSHKILSWNQQEDSLVISDQTAFFDNGNHECIKIILEDGRELLCTHDHLIANSDGEWVEARNLKVNSRVKVGPILPSISEDTGNTILCRILGYLLTDGHIGKDRCIAYFGNKMDAKIFSLDIEAISGIYPTIRKSKGENCFSVYIPAVLGNEIKTVDGIVIGNKTNNSHGLPTYILEWPREEQREFLGGIFGGDGWCTTICSNNKITPVGLTQSRRDKHDISKFMELVKTLLFVFEIPSSYTIMKRGSLFIGNLRIPQNYLDTFLTSIGYRYCYHKTLKTSVSVMYYRKRKLFNTLCVKFYQRILELKEEGLSIATSYSIAKVELQCGYLPTYKTINGWIQKGLPVDRKDMPYSRSFTKTTEFVESIGGASTIFGTYAMKKDQEYLPTFNLSITSIEYVGNHKVFDIEVADTHSFMANGVVVHNCVQDSALVLNLFHKLQTWVGLCEMAKVCNVPIFVLYTQGQQIKVFSQMYKYCLFNNIVVEKDGYIPKDNEHYQGATVFDPIPGVYDRVVPFDFCLTGDTLVTLANGLSKRLDELEESKSLLSFDGSGFTESKSINGLQIKGTKETVKIFFQDGECIECTPDHKFMLSDGTWAEACNLKGHMVKCGLKYPYDNVSVLEHDWKLAGISMKNNREKVLALVRMLGYLYTNLYTNLYPNKKGNIKAFFRTYIDACSFKQDISLFTDVDSVVEKRNCRTKGTTFCLNIPSKILVLIQGIVVGERSLELPCFLFEDECPASVIREFIGGLFGDGGNAPFLTNKNNFDTISFRWMAEKKYKVSTQLCKLLHKLDVNSKCKHESILTIPKDSLLSFSKNVGFRYSVNKSLCLNVVESYYKFCDYKNWVPTVTDYVDELGVLDWFSLESTHTHAVKSDDVLIPSFYKRVIDVRNNGVKPVYDIEVKDTHNFIANGAVTHNCSLYPTTIIAYNIDYSTLVIDPKVPDKDCHVMEWEDHVACLASDTSITYLNHNQRISDGKSIVKNKAFSLVGGGVRLNNQVAWLDQGVKKCVNIYMLDGTKLTCTPDHKLYTGNGWKNAEDIILGIDCVYKSIEFPTYTYTSTYTLNFNGRCITGEKLLIFSRVLGYMMFDGKSKFEQHYSYSIFLGHINDAHHLIEDMYTLTGIRKKIPNKSSSAWCIRLPHNYFKGVEKLGLTVGSKVVEGITIPAFIWDSPKDVKREFLAGIFGADGCVSKSASSIGSISLERQFNNGNKSIFEKLFKELQLLLEEFSISSTINTRNKSLVLYIPCNEVPIFYKEIGVRYCVHKLLRLMVASSYYTYRQSIIKQVGYTVKNRHGLTITEARDRACEKIYSKPSVQYVIDKMRSRVKHLYSVEKFLKITDSFSIFQGYGLNKDELVIPTIKIPVIGREEVGERDVYDISMEKHHSFLANGIVVHNCVHDTTVRKSKPKHPMCAKRYYRFLKEPKGVMPTILSNLLNARKNTKKEIKKLKKELAAGKGNKKELELLIEVLDKRQLAYKVSSNSMYGVMGVQRGYLPFMPGAMCTTAMGRMNINKVAEIIPRDYGGKLIYGDTDCVKGSTPVLVRSQGRKSYITVQELSQGDWKAINPNKDIATPLEGVEIWSDQGFTKVKNVVRCRAVKPLTRIVTHVGEVTCSNEHSLLTEDLKCVSPVEVKLKDKLCITELPLPEDTPKEPVYPNNLTVQKIRDYVIPDVVYDELHAELAFVLGVFFADGSCGTYKQKNGKYNCSSWAINKKDKTLLERCCDILNKHERSVVFKILDTVKSSHVYKLVAKQYSRKLEHKGDVELLCTKYRDLFYDPSNLKKIPDIIINAPYGIREAFFMGYYAGDVSKKDPALSFTNKGGIGSAGLFYLLRSLGYKVSLNTRKDKPDTYKLTGSTPSQKFRYKPNAVKKIIPIQEHEEEYIYDIQTENHHFAAGVGELVVHNSNYISFPHLETKSAAEIWDYSEKVAKEVSKIFPDPVELAFEEVIYWRFMILTKKRYMSLKCYRDGKISDKIEKKGVLLARRDNCQYIRHVYSTTIMKIFNREPEEKIIYNLLQEINRLCSGYYPHTDFKVTKSIGSIGDGIKVIPFQNEKGQIKGKLGNYTVPLLSTEKKERERQFKLKDCDTEEEYYIRCLPAQVQLAERMRKRGQRVSEGSRLGYVITMNIGHTAKQYYKIESSDYFSKHGDVLKLDYFYYLKLLSNSMDQVLNVLYKDDKKGLYQLNFTLNQYKYRYKIREKFLTEIKELFQPKLKFQEN